MVDDAKLLLALEDATAEINGFIDRKVNLSDFNPPRMLKVICRDIAMYRLYVNSGGADDNQKTLYESASKYLKMVGEGKISIGDETGGDEAQTSQGVVMDDGPDRVMTRDSLRGF